MHQPARYLMQRDKGVKRGLSTLVHKRHVIFFVYNNWINGQFWAFFPSVRINQYLSRAVQIGVVYASQWGIKQWEN